MDRVRGPISLILRKLREHRLCRGIFNVPVDPVSLGIPTYFLIIKEPMDLGTIKKKLDRDLYQDCSQVSRDIRLVFNNAMTFNKPDTFVYTSAKGLLKFFNYEWSILEKNISEANSANMAHSCERCNGNACNVCDKKCLIYQDPVLRCSLPCKTRIPRGASYYRLGGERGQHWCNRCYMALTDSFTGLLGQTIMKKDLERCVNDSVFYEPWISCSDCKRPFHQNCVLYHSFLGTRKPFLCPICTAEFHGLPFGPLKDSRSVEIDGNHKSKRKFKQEEKSDINIYDTIYCGGDNEYNAKAIPPHSDGPVYRKSCAFSIEAQFDFIW